VIFRAFRYRLYPTADQERTLEQFVGAVRFVYNLAWEQRRDHWRAFRRATGRSISWASQSREVTQLRAEVDWLSAVPRECLEQALRDLDGAYRRFFKGGGYPSPRRRGINDSIRFQGRAVRARANTGRMAGAKVPGVGWIKYRHTRDMLGACRNVTISRDALGWHISFACEIEHEAMPGNLPAVGIDRGVANTVALSTGELLSLPDMTAIDRRHRHAQRVLARRKKGSKRRQRQKARVARLAAKRARVRLDWHHKTSADIARRFGHVALEDLNVRGMTAKGRGKRGLNRSILNQGWHAFERLLAYKLDERGGTLDKVPAAYTSQTCSACGAIDKGSRESQAAFRCLHCGFAIHADENAAINIRRRSSASLRVEAARWGADEARTAHTGLRP
jgi:putative transposase